MPTWTQALREGAFTGTLASLLSCAYATWAGRRAGRPAAPMNAVSHWYFGDAALRKDETSPKYTVAGYLTHHGAALFWAVIHARFWGAAQRHRQALPALAGAVATSGLACLVDYQLTPRRLHPGYEHRLSGPDLVAVYGLFALGLALGSVLLRKRAPGRPLPRQEQPGPAACASGRPAQRPGRQQPFAATRRRIL